jgi:C4-type Zn-finger protein
MIKQQTITCPVCKKDMIISCFTDPNVGIPFEFDVLEGSDCICDRDDEEVDLQQYEAAHDSYFEDYFGVR